MLLLLLLTPKCARVQVLAQHSHDNRRYTHLQVSTSVNIRKHRG